MRSGDTEEMVLIALGPPDKVQPITSQEGQKQTAWLYDLLEFGSGYSPYDPTSSPPPHLESREQSVIFRNGVVVDKVGVAVEDLTTLAEFRAKLKAENMEARLDSLVTLTLEQKVNACNIFEKANEELSAFSLNERGEKGVPIRVKMRADIRAMLTAEQQSKYDETPQYLGGGSTKRQ